MSFDVDSTNPPGAKIKVIGVGGGGNNAVNTMVKAGLEGVEFIAANTDVQALRFALPETKIQIGKELTKGLGAGADPDIGRDAALEDRHEIQQALAESDMVFITAGMGGGTGTGGASVVAQIARELGALTVAVITKPFHFEGKRRRKHADIGIERLRESVDTLITIPNQRLLQIATPNLSMVDAFKMADEVLVNAVRGISDIINIPGRVNVDFADVRAVMSSMGMALMGIGSAAGDNRAIEAARKAICSPLLEDVDIEGATGILINITASSSIGLMEISDACSIIQDAAHEDANIIFGAVIDDQLGDEIRVTVIATGFPADFEEEVAPTKVFFPKRELIKKPSALAKPVFPKTERFETPVAKAAPAPTPAPTKPPPEPATAFDQRHEFVNDRNDVEDLTRLTFSMQPNEISSLAAPHSLSSFSFSEVQDQEIPPPAVFKTDMEIEGATVRDVVPQPEARSATELPSEPELGVLAIDSMEEIAPSEEINFYDKQIDEALEIAERIKGDEDLDVPSFLRAPAKEISLE